MSKSLEEIQDSVSMNGYRTKYSQLHYGLKEIVSDIANGVYVQLKEQRQKDLQAISYHFAIPVSELEKVLDSKETL